MPFGNGPLGSNPENGWFKMVNDSITDELAGVLIIIGALFIAFSKEKIEDEFVMKIRLESLVWAIIVNSLILLICLLAFYGFSFLYVLDINIVSILVLYVIKFRYELWKSEKYEKHT
jgi:amino acid transporter